MVKLGHVHLKVSDLERAERFYMGVFGFRVVERVGDEYVFFSLGKQHHDFALRNMGGNAERPDKKGTGLYHVAFEVKNRKELAERYKKLIDMDVEVRAVDHGISEALYFFDPDGNGLEIYLDTRHKRKMWKGESSVLDTEKLLSLLDD